jgi:gamma-carbonic anhydrase
MVEIHPDAWVSPHAILCGPVTIGAGSRVLDLAVIDATQGPVTIGRDVVVMERAVLRGSTERPVQISDWATVGPQYTADDAHPVGDDRSAAAS